MALYIREKQASEKIGFVYAGMGALVSEFGDYGIEYRGRIKHTLNGVNLSIGDVIIIDNFRVFDIIPGDELENKYDVLDKNDVEEDEAEYEDECDDECDCEQEQPQSDYEDFNQKMNQLFENFRQESREFKENPRSKAKSYEDQARSQAKSVLSELGSALENFSKKL